MTEIQRRTPERLTGKVMAFVYTLSLCAQPVGQLVYGALFDTVDAAWVLLPSAAWCWPSRLPRADFSHVWTCRPPEFAIL